MCLSFSVYAWRDSLPWTFLPFVPALVAILIARRGDASRLLFVVVGSMAGLFVAMIVCGLVVPDIEPSFVTRDCKPVAKLAVLGLGAVLGALAGSKYGREVYKAISDWLG
jgi:ABC-type Co2+ transport system permease subunit